MSSRRSRDEASSDILRYYRPNDVLNDGDAAVHDPLLGDPSFQAELARRSDSSLASCRRGCLSVVRAFVGPGMVVMLADTDPGCVITAAESGAQWGYSLILLQIALVPALYTVQELTARLALFTGCGQGELIRLRFGPFWASVAVAALLVACCGALVSQLTCLAGVGLVFGVPPVLTLVLVCAFLTTVVLSGSYSSVQSLLVCFGAFEVFFVVLMFMADPNPAEVWTGVVDQRRNVKEPRWWLLVAANIGAVVMPWMIFFQQSSVVDEERERDDLARRRRRALDGALGDAAARDGADWDGSTGARAVRFVPDETPDEAAGEAPPDALAGAKGRPDFSSRARAVLDETRRRCREDPKRQLVLEQRLFAARINTFVGACATQLIMCSVIVLFAAAVWAPAQPAPSRAGGKLPPPAAAPQHMTRVEDLSAAVAKYVGATAGRLIFGAAMSGAGLLAAVVVSLTAAWGLGELQGFERSLQQNAAEAPRFYGAYVGMLLVGAALTLWPPVDIVFLNVGVCVMNALLLPLVLGMLYGLARSDVLPRGQRLRGVEAVATGAVFVVLSGLGLVGGVVGVMEASG